MYAVIERIQLRHTLVLYQDCYCSELLGAEGVEPEVGNQGHIGHDAENLEGSGLKRAGVLESAETGQGGEHAEECAAGDETGGDECAAVATGVIYLLIL